MWKLHCAPYFGNLYPMLYFPYQAQNMSERIRADEAEMAQDMPALKIQPVAKLEAVLPKVEEIEPEIHQGNEEEIVERGEECSEPIKEQSNEKRPNNKTQKLGRNIFSNIFRSYIRFLKSEEFIKDIFPIIKEQRGIELNEHELMKKVRGSTQRLKSYVRKREIRNFFGLNESRYARLPDFLEILRISIQYYLRNIYLIEIFHSKKIRKDFKKTHMMESRKFLSMIHLTAEQKLSEEKLSQ